MQKKRKKKKNIIAEQPKMNLFAEKVKELTAGLYYISETDAEILPFEGAKAEAVTRENILIQTNNQPDAPVEERDFAEIFARLTEIKEWFGEEEKAVAGKFSALQTFLEENLKEIKVFKISKIQIDIYFVGLDAESYLKGIKTKAVET